MPETRLTVKYEHGIADTQRLEIQDAAISLQGLSRALLITTDAYLNGRVSHRVDRVDGVRVYLEPFRAGSFVETVTIWTEQNPLSTALAVGVAVNYLTQFISWAFKETVGFTLPEPEEPLSSRIEPVIGRLPAVLENPVRMIHKPIFGDSRMTISVTPANEPQIITFNEQTGEGLRIINEGLQSGIRRKVTRYNVLSGWGRFYDDAEERTISFNISKNLPQVQRSLLTWSLDQLNNAERGQLIFDAFVIKTSSGIIKSYRVTNVRTDA